MEFFLIVSKVQKTKIQLRSNKLLNVNNVYSFFFVLWAIPYENVMLTALINPTANRISRSFHMHACSYQSSSLFKEKSAPLY